MGLPGNITILPSEPTLTITEDPIPLDLPLLSTGGEPLGPLLDAFLSPPGSALLQSSGGGFQSGTLGLLGDSPMTVVPSETPGAMPLEYILRAPFIEPVVFAPAIAIGLSWVFGGSPELPPSKNVTLDVKDLTNEDANVRMSAVLKIGASSNPRAVDALVTALGDEDLAVVAQASLTLEEIGETSVPALINALKSSDEGTRDIVIDILGEFKDPRAVEPLLKIVKNGYEDKMTRTLAVEALGAIGDMRAFEALSILSATGEIRDEDDWHFLTAVDEAKAKILENNPEK